MPTRDPQEWIQQTRKRWALLVQAAVWVLSVIGGFLLPPPVGVSPGDEKMWLRLAQFIVAVVVGLIFFAAVKWHRRRHAKAWWTVALVFLALSVLLFFRYQQLIYAWTVEYAGGRTLIGAEMTPVGARYARENPSLTRDLLLMHFAGRANDVWTIESINRRRTLLAAAYILCLPLFTICLIAVVQAIHCVSPAKSGRSASTSG